MFVLDTEFYYFTTVYFSGGNSRTYNYVTSISLFLGAIGIFRFQNPLHLARHRIRCSFASSAGIIHCFPLWYHRVLQLETNVGWLLCSLNDPTPRKDSSNKE
jgi:hypothetical protein